MRTVAIILVAIGLTACARVRTITIPQPFDAAQAESMLQPGSNTIKGSALIRQRGGGVVTCAGNRVTLIPATDYAAQRVSLMFGGQKFQPPLYGVIFKPDPPRYSALTRSTTCNAQGFFQFDRVSNGDFFLVTKITWMAGYEEQGGNLSARITVNNGESAEVTLTP